jgi:hypothetical protein
MILCLFYSLICCSLVSQTSCWFVYFLEYLYLFDHFNRLLFVLVILLNLILLYIIAFAPSLISHLYLEELNYKQNLKLNSMANFVQDIRYFMLQLNSVGFFDFNNQKNCLSNLDLIYLLNIILHLIFKISYIVFFSYSYFQMFQKCFLIL